MVRGTLEVLLVGAKGLDDTDFLSKMDPYAILLCCTQEQKSSVASGKGSDPEWNETFVFTVSDDVPELVIKLMDSDAFSDEFVGEANSSRTMLSCINCYGFKSFMHGHCFGFPWSPSFWNEGSLLLYTMWSRMGNIVEKSSLASLSFQRKITEGTVKIIMVGGKNHSEWGSADI